jgi:hypothetical protein
MIKLNTSSAENWLRSQSINGMWEGGCYECGECDECGE